MEKSSELLIPDSQNWQGRTVLVTGCSGFIGGVISATLIAVGANVVGLLRDPNKDCYLFRSAAGGHERMTILTGDLGDIDYVRNALLSHNVDAVLHLAGESILGRGDGMDVYAMNVAVTENLLKAMTETRPDAALILASTDMVYGPCSSQPFDESMRPSPHNPYGRSKYESELLVNRYVEERNLVAGIVRLSNVYGGGDMNFSRLIPGTVLRILAGEPPTLRSDGQSIRDFVHVDDVVRGILSFLAALASGRLVGEVHNLGAGQSVPVIAVVTQLLNAVAYPERVPILGPPDDSGDAERHISIDKAFRNLNWIPRISLSQGLEQTINWYENAGCELMGEV